MIRSNDNLNLKRSWAPVTLALILAFGIAGGFALAADEKSDDEPVLEKRVKVYAEKWRFVPSEIRVPVGTELTLELLSRDASRTFSMKKGYKIKVPMPQDRKKEFTFTADKEGEFRFFCGRPCGNGCSKMSGKLIVEPYVPEDGDGS